MDLLSRNSNDGSSNLADPIILAAETSQKDNLHLGEAMKSDDCEDYMTVSVALISALRTVDH